MGDSLIPNLSWYIIMKSWSLVWLWPQVWILKEDEDLQHYAFCERVCTAVCYLLTINTSVGKGVRALYTADIMLAYVLKFHFEVQYYVSIQRKNNQCISEDDKWFLKMDYSQLNTKHWEEMYREGKYVLWVMVWFWKTILFPF